MNALFDGRAVEYRRELLVLARDAHRRGVAVPEAVGDLIRMLHAAAEAPVSEVGSATPECETIDDMRLWGSPDEVGRQVGLSGRRIRMFCAAGLVAHRRHGGGRYLVSLVDTQRHLRERAA